MSRITQHEIALLYYLVYLDYTRRNEIISHFCLFLFDLSFSLLNIEDGQNEYKNMDVFFFNNVLLAK